MRPLARRLGWALLLAAGLVWAWAARSPQVRVVNSGSTPLLDLTASITGARHHLGSLDPSEGVAKRLRPQGESHIELDWSTPDGQRHRHVVDCYFEGGWPSYSGWALVEIDGGRVLRTDKRISLGP